MPLPNDTTTNPRPRVLQRLASVLGIVLLWHGHLARVRSWPGWTCHFRMTPLPARARGCHTASLRFSALFCCGTGILPV